MRVSTRRVSQVPIDRKIFGHFIEVGFGRQVEGMWSEMIYNRSFVPIPPYRWDTWNWLGLSPQAYNANAPFWHSGYEELDWELIAPDHSTKTRALTETYKGKTVLQLTYDGSGSGGGLRQRGIRLKAGEAYHFRLFGSMGAGGPGTIRANRTSKETVPVRIIFRPEANSSGILAETAFALAVNGKEFHFEFSNQSYTGRATLEIVVDRSALLWLSWCSLMPQHTVRGWRPDVVALLKQVRPPIIRFPGGCYASWHDWRLSVGPRSERPADASFLWGGLDENDIGIDEFLDLCHELECEPQVCVNMQTSRPFDAADLVEYCNGGDDTRLGRFRKRNGVTRLNRVTYWEMDNEAWRKWSALDYAKKVVEFGEQMRERDPNIKLMMLCYGYNSELHEMLQIAGKSIDIVATRTGPPTQLEAELDVIREYNRQNGTRILLANTEWLAAQNDLPEPDPEIPPRRRGGQGDDYKAVLSFRQIHWFYALNAAKILTGFLSVGGELCSTNFNNLVNTWGQNILEASKESAWLSPTGRVYEFLADLDVRYAIKTDINAPAGVYLTAQACETSDGKGINLLIVNQGRKEVRTELQLPTGYRIESCHTIWGSRRLARTSPGHSDIQEQSGKVQDQRVLAFRPLSVSIVYARA